MQLKKMYEKHPECQPKKIGRKRRGATKLAKPMKKKIRKKTL